MDLWLTAEEQQILEHANRTNMATPPAQWTPGRSGRFTPSRLAEQAKPMVLGHAARSQRYRGPGARDGEDNALLLARRSAGRGLVHSKVRRIVRADELQVGRRLTNVVAWPSP
jgi:hypothetical protein